MGVLCCSWWHFFKAVPSLALPSPEGPPASHAGPVRGCREPLLSSGGHWAQGYCTSQPDVQGGVGALEAGPLVGHCDRVVLGSACQEGRADMVPWAHAHLKGKIRTHTVRKKRKYYYQLILTITCLFSSLWRLMLAFR